MSDDATFFVDLDGLWVDVDRIIAFRATDDGHTTLYCEDAASFRVGLTPEQIMRKIEDAVLPVATTSAPYLYGGQPAQHYPSVFTTYNTPPITPGATP